MKRTLVVAAVLLLTGCAWLTEYGRREGSAREALAQGQYDQAVTDSVQSLKDKPDHLPAREILNEALPKAVDRHRTRAEAAKTAEDWERAAEEYSALVFLADLVGTLPGTMRTSAGSPYGLPRGEFEAQLKNARQRAGEQLYGRGLEAQGQPGVKAARRAALLFGRSRAYTPDYQDVAARYEAARKAGTERVAILPFRERSDGDFAHDLEAGVLEDLQADPLATEFAELIAPGRFEALGWRRELVFAGLLNPDQLKPLRDSVDKAVYARVANDKVTISPIDLEGPFKAETTVRDSSGNSVPVHARYVVKKWRARAEVEVEAHVFDVRDPAKDTTARFAGSASDSSEWAERLDGDERAFDADHRVGRTTPRMPPEPGALRRSAGADIRRQLAAWLRNRLRESD